MNYRDRDVGTSVAGLAVVLLLGAAVAFLVMMVPAALRALAIVGRAQASLVDRALNGGSALTGWMFDGESIGVRLLGAAVLYFAVASCLYFLFLVGSNLATLILFAGGSALIGIALTAIGILRFDTREDLLDGLKYWNQR